MEDVVGTSDSRFGEREEIWGVSLIVKSVRRNQPNDLWCGTKNGRLRVDKQWQLWQSFGNITSALPMQAWPCIRGGDVPHSRGAFEGLRRHADRPFDYEYLST